MRRTLRIGIIPILLLALTAGCTTFVKDANRGLLAFEAAYKIEEPVREAFCKDKAPQPPACVSALAAAKAGWETYQSAAGLLATYIEVKTDDAKATLIRMIPELVKATVKLTTVAQELK